MKNEKLKLFSAIAMIAEMFKHQQRTITGISGRTNNYPCHSHKSKTFKKNKRRGY